MLPTMAARAICVELRLNSGIQYRYPYTDLSGTQFNRVTRKLKIEGRIGGI